MTDKEMYTLIQQFVQEHTLATNIDVTIMSGGSTMKPKPGMEASLDEANLLHDLIQGATSFLWWARRNGYTVLKNRTTVQKDRTCRKRR